MRQEEDLFQHWDDEASVPAEPNLAEDEALSPAGIADEADDTGASDPFGLYLRQMGSIPMLSREQELELTERLDRLRRRYRRAGLWSPAVLQRVVETFERIQAGTLPLDRTIDEIPTLGLTADKIRPRLRTHLRNLRKLLDEAKGEFQEILRARSSRERAVRRRGHRSLLRRAIRLAEELSPRTELLDTWTAELQQSADRLDDLAGARPQQRKDLRTLMLQLQTTPEELAGLLQVVKQRRAAYRQVRSQLAESNLRLVVSIAKHYRGQGLPLADMIQEGNSGLMRAVDKFDHRLGWKFGTYATWWIRQGITRALADHSHTIRVPCHQASVLRAMNRVRCEVAAQSGREPTLEEVAAALQIKPEEARLLQMAEHQPASLDETFGDDQDGSLQDFLHDRSPQDLAGEVDRRLLRDRLAEVLRCLPLRDREVIELRFGLNDGRPRSLEEVADLFKVTRERVRQIEARALGKLRQPERSTRLAGFSEAS